MSGYELSRNWFDWCFENPEKINPNHTAMYFFIIEHSNRMGWKQVFGLPTTMVKDAIGIKSYNTYKKTLDDLVEFGFIKMVERSKNQYSSNIIALLNFDKALDKALDKAMSKHLIKQSESTCQSTDSINKHINLITNKQENEEQPKIQSQFNDYELLDIKTCRTQYDKLYIAAKEQLCMTHRLMPATKLINFQNQFDAMLIGTGTNSKILGDYAKHFANWLGKQETSLADEHKTILKFN